MSARLLTLLCSALLACGLLAAGCGGDDDEGGEASKSRQKAIDRCVEEAKQVPRGQERETAIQACKTAGSKEPEEAKKLREDAIKLCLDQAKKIPDENARKQAEDTCRRAQEQ